MLFAPGISRLHGNGISQLVDSDKILTACGNEIELPPPHDYNCFIYRNGIQYPALSLYMYASISNFQLRLSPNKAEKSNTSAKCLLGNANKFINFFFKYNFALVFDFSALLGDNLN